MNKINPIDSPHAHVQTVARSAIYSFSKNVVDQIRLIEGYGVEGDVHAGETVRHRSRVARDPSQPNLRQVHLIHSELLLELGEKGFRVKPGDLGENITTACIPLLELPTGTLLHIGDEAIVELTGLRNPCHQLNDFHSGLMEALLDRAADGTLIRKCGVMGVVRRGGAIHSEDLIVTKLPDRSFQRLEKV